MSTFFKCGIQRLAITKKLKEIQQEIVEVKHKIELCKRRVEIKQQHLNNNINDIDVKTIAYTDLVLAKTEHQRWTGALAEKTDLIRATLKRRKIVNYFVEISILLLSRLLT